MTQQPFDKAIALIDTANSEDQNQESSGGKDWPKELLCSHRMLDMLDFVNKHPEYDEEKWIHIIRKTWNKMSDRAQQLALAGHIKFPNSLAALIQKAISV